MTYRSAQGGNVAIMVAICIVPLLFMAGFMIDFSRQQSLSRKVQASVDHAAVSVALMLQENENTSMEELSAVAQAVFDGNLNADASLLRSPVLVSEANGIVNVSFDGEMATGLAGLMGVSELAVNAVSAVQYNGVVGQLPLDIALVLDVSESMQGARIDTLRQTANDLVDAAIPDATSLVQIGIVPFNGFVNVGLGNRGQSWLTDTDDETLVWNTCPTDFDASEALGCTFNRVCGPAGSEAGCSNESSCPAGVSIVKHPCFDRIIDNEWHGCVRERDDPLDITDGSYGSDPIRGVLDDDQDECLDENQILPLSNNAADIKSAIDDLTPAWQTYIPSGITWGRRILSSGEPFNQPNNDGRAKAIILLSDGANTGSLDPSSGLVSGTDPDDANDRMIEACEAAKAEDISVFTIAFSVNDFETERLLEDCASNQSASFEANTLNGLSDAFASIVSSFEQIALVE
ncbi:MAG: pilus assembly protein TadG-related protein [Hyphomonadaceae bacterium]